MKAAPTSRCREAVVFLAAILLTSALLLVSPSSSAAQAQSCEVLEHALRSAEEDVVLATTKAERTFAQAVVAELEILLQICENNRDVPGDYVPDFGNADSAPGHPPGVDDPYICGAGFFGMVSGGTPPYQLSYTLISEEFGSIPLPSFEVSEMGSYATPAGYVDYSTTPDGAYTVILSLRDTSDPAFEIVPAFEFDAFITDECDTAPEDQALAEGDTLASTGAETRDAVLLAFALIVVGAMAVVSSRKHTRTDNVTGSESASDRSRR